MATLARLIGWIGLLGLALIAGLGMAIAIEKRDWSGIGLMLFLAALIIFFARTLWRGARMERTRGRLSEGWDGEPLGNFFRSVVLRTLEGRIYLAGALACWLVAVLAVPWPGAVGIAPELRTGHAVLFGIWPVIGFAAYVTICGPKYETRLFSLLVVLAATLAPFWMVYGRHLSP